MENANEAIYIGVYTMIFVIALSLTVMLYSNLMRYVDNAYDYMNSVTNDAVTVNSEVNRHLILSGQEVLSYYYNYIKRDRFDDNDATENTVVTINLNTKDENPSYLEGDTLSYKEVASKIGLSNKYILTVSEDTNENTTHVNIIKATDEELNENW